MILDYQSLMLLILKTAGKEKVKKTDVINDLVARDPDPTSNELLLSLIRTINDVLAIKFLRRVVRPPHSYA